MKLYGFWRSSATWRVRIALAYKGIEYEYVPVHLQRGGGEQHRPEFRAKNPMGYVPVLELSVDGRERQIAESMAILELLEELHPFPALLPSDAFLRARTRQIALLIVAGIQPLQNTAVRLWVERELGADGAAWTRHWITRGLEAVETLVRETAGTYAVGNAVTHADACIVPQLYAARRFGVDTEPYPTLRTVEAACAILPPFIAAHASSQPDAESA
ncbi:MAG TPA: maleylacetoacetate isomerase [Polyangiaceae bacterium]|nr:maleylacetoacetate isomerase [Polyangiaceae bacterium]